MKRVALTLVLTGFVFVGGQAFGAKDDVVYFREPGKKKDTEIRGKIEEESPAGIKIKPAKAEAQSISPLQIAQVEYGAGVDALGRTDFCAGDTKLTLALRDMGKKREEGLRKALLNFQTLGVNDKLRGVAPIQRYFQFRIAQTLYYQARDDASRRDAALAALTEYKSNFADGWEIVPALQALASLQEDKGDIEAASQTFTDLANLSGIDPAMKLQSQLKGARLMMTAKKFADAEKKLRGVKAQLSANDPQQVFVEAYLIQSRIAQKGNLDGVDKELEKILHASKDGNVLALAHNSLGDYYRAKEDLAQAFWQYCKVDMLYNQDREEHAKALYYLSKLYDRPRNDLARAEEALTRLKSNLFDGTLFQRQAMAEKKPGE